MKTVPDTNAQCFGDSDPAIEDVQFCDNYLPLTAGDYTITATYEIAAPGLSEPSFTQTQDFTIDGPRFSLDATDIQTQFPANKSQGQFDTQFPYIVLTKRALPWERELALQPPQPSEPTIPWFALVVFQESEIILDPPPANPSANPTMAKTYPLSQILQPEPGVLGPVLPNPPADLTTLCRAIDISPATFTALLPRLNELKYLAHTRNIDVAGFQYKSETELRATGKATGWFSVVMANRLPISPAAGSTSFVRNIVHLVSLEGWQNYLIDEPKFPNNPSKLRLISLASWTFNCLADPKENFATLMMNFVAQQTSGGEGLLLKMPTTAAPTNDPNHQLAQEILNHGYAPLSYRTRAGDQTYSWYRSPLTPLPIAEFVNSKSPPYPAAEAALIYDQATGLFDQSYAVAWQTGRLLALADRSFSVDLLNWRRQTNQALRSLVHRLNSPHVSKKLKHTNTVAQIRQLLRPKLISKSFVHYLGHDFANEIAPQVASLGRHDQPQLKPIEQSHSPAQNSVQALQQFMRQPEAPAIFKRVLLAIHERDEANDLLQRVVDWLSRLALLYGVPFDTLVPNQQMLPAESIRFFYIDPNAIDIMIDGALSLGVQSSQDSLFNQLAKDTIRQAVYQSLPTIRARLLGKESDLPAVTKPVAGFLLRSQVVSAFPGLEIKSYQASDGKNPSTPMEPLRIERLTNDVLLCLLPHVPAWIELNEPKESFGFGIEDDGKAGGKEIDLRNVKTTNSQPAPGSFNGLKQTVLFRSSSSTVLNVNALQTQIQQQMQGKLNNPDGIISPAEFAIQLIRAPEKMVFQNVQPSSSSL